jgi:hypothetical protein
MQQDGPRLVNRVRPTPVNELFIDKVAADPVRFRQAAMWFFVVAMVLLAAMTVLLFVLVVDDDDGDERDLNGAQLVLTDSQRLVLGSPLVIPEAGDSDIILILVSNADDHEVVNITVNIVVTSETNKRTTSMPDVLCPPLYVDNVVPSLQPKTSTTCRALYVLTSGDVLNGNVIHTASQAVGYIGTTSMTTIALPGMSDLSINNLDMPEGAVLGIAGPTGATGAVGPAGPFNVKVGPCSTTSPLTTFVCDDSDQLALLVCDLASNKTLIGNVYLCMGAEWVFFGSLDVMPGGGNSTGPTGPTGPPGVGIYAATCSGGPPPTDVSNPSYTCNATFDLNMVLCNLGSTDGNAGIIYLCSCTSPSSCSWSAVANINGMVTYLVEHCFNFPFVNTPNVWNTLCMINLPTVGSYYCLAEGTMRQTDTTQSCSLFYGLTSTAETDTWMHNSDRLINLPPSPTNPTGPPLSQQWHASILTTAVVFTTTANEMIYFTAGVGNQTAGCGHWAPSVNMPETINCIAVDVVI